MGSMECKCCGQAKAEIDFYANDKTCKECRKAKVRNHYHNNPEYQRSRDKLSHRVDARKRYAKTDAGKCRANAAKKAYIERNPLKRAAHIAVGNALRDGKLSKQPCEICSDEVAEAHHDDYSKPLDVRWLCDTHHKAWHKQDAQRLRDLCKTNNEGLNETHT